MGNSAGKNEVPRNRATGSSSRRVHWGGAGVPAPPGKPILIPVSTEDAQPDVVGIRWERSASNGGSAIVGYQVEHRRMGSPYWVRSSPSLCSFPELTLSGLEPGWRYQFRVRARNGLGVSEASVLSDPLTVTLQRSAASAPRFDLELKDTLALENDQAEFTVHFSGAPLPKISWFKDGFEIFSSRRTRIITENGKSQLLIHQTALNDEGEIKCTATNRAGHVATKAKLLLEAPPKIRLPRQYEDGLLFEQDETIRLKVCLAGRPLPTVGWYHDGEPIVADAGHVLETSDSGECALKITSAKRGDRGEYTVRAGNKLGEDVASFLVTVTDRPSPPGKATIAMTLGRSVSLAWTEPEDDGGCKIGTYIVEYYRIGWDMWLKAATCRQSTATLGELIEGSEYRFRVKAENPYGLSDPSDQSDVVFIPDPKRGINSPPMRPDKSQSQREIHRGRGAERRDRNIEEPTKRTRSLTREEAIRGAPGDGFEGGPPTRSASAHRLAGAPTPPSRPSRADSRVTFADTVYLHVEKPLEDSSSPTRPKTKRDATPSVPDDRQLSSTKRDTVQEAPALEKTESTPRIVRQPTFDDSGGRDNLPIDPRLSTSAEHTSPPSSPSTKPVEYTSFANKIGQPEDSSLSGPSSPREEDDRDEAERSLRGSSEFILVLYPDEDPSPRGTTSLTDGSVPTDSDPLQKSPLTRNAFSEGEEEDEDDEDLVAPPMSLSLPELFSANHEVVEVLREAVSSTELLHERAMERFYRAVALEEAESAKKNSISSKSVEKEESRASPMDGSALSSSSVRVRNTRLRRRASGAGSSVQAVVTTPSWNRRRFSEGHNEPSRMARGVAASLPPPVPQSVASDPNLPKRESEIGESDSRSDVSRLEIDSTFNDIAASDRSKLRRWDDRSMPLVPAEYTEIDESVSSRSQERFSVATNGASNKDAEERKIDESSDAELRDEELEEESDSSEDVKLLKSRIVARPVVDEEDTYHPRGRPTPHDVSSPEPACPPMSEHRGPMTPNNVAGQPPKSILKRRTEEEPLPVNRFGRPIPPEMPIAERQKRRIDANETEEAMSEDTVNRRTRSTASPEATNTPEFSEMDGDSANLLSVAEVARSRRRLSAQKPQSPTKTSFEEEEDLRARMAVIDHYTEIVREYSMAHSVAPPYRRGNALPVNAERTAAPAAHDSIDETKADDRASAVSPVARTAISENATNTRKKNGVGSRSDATRTSEESRQSRRSSRRESPRSSRSGNVSTERPGTPRGSRSSSRTRKRDVSRERRANTGKNEASRDRVGSRSSSKTRIAREESQEKAPSRSRKERSVSRSRPSSRATSKERHHGPSVDRNPSDLETRPKISGRNENNGKTIERATRPNSRIERLSTLETEARAVPRIDAAAVKKVRTTVGYATDLTLLIAAVYVYLFKKEILAVPIIGLVLYRRIQEDIDAWIPDWWRMARKR